MQPHSFIIRIMHKFHHFLLRFVCWQWHSEMYVMVKVRITAGLSVSCSLFFRLVRGVVKKALCCALQYKSFTGFAYIFCNLLHGGWESYLIHWKQGRKSS